MRPRNGFRNVGGSLRFLYNVCRPFASLKVEAVGFSLDINVYRRLEEDETFILGKEG